LRLQPQPGSYSTAPSDRPSNVATVPFVPGGTTLQVLSKQGIPAQGNWVKLKVCSLPLGSNPAKPATSNPGPSPSPTSTASTPPTPPPTPGDRLPPLGASGWIEEAVLTPLLVPNPTFSANQLGSCSGLKPEDPTSTGTTAPTPSSPPTPE
ncbi:MAG TPA: hypothetical protein V6D04_13135, partial [Candidatus Obscuribacterales bacterium]